MTIEIDFVPFATGEDANVLDLTDYFANPATANGYVNGPADPQHVGRALRQGTFMAAVLANWISQVLDASVLDDGDLSGAVSQLATAIGVGVSYLAPRAAPAAPTSGYIMYCDQADGLLKVIDSNGDIGVIPLT